MGTPADGLARLREAARSDALDELRRAHRFRVLTVFGSAGRGESTARDLDVGVLVEAGAPFDASAATVALIELTGTDRIDLAHLNRAGPVLRERALVGSVGLSESEPAALADAAVAAIAERIETDPMRRLNLELMAARWLRTHADDPPRPPD